MCVCVLFQHVNVDRLMYFEKDNDHHHNNHVRALQTQSLLPGAEVKAHSELLPVHAAAPLAGAATSARCVSTPIRTGRPPGCEQRQRSAQQAGQAQQGERGYCCNSAAAAGPHLLQQSPRATERGVTGEDTWFSQQTSCPRGREVHYKLCVRSAFGGVVLASSTRKPTKTDGTVNFLNWRALTGGTEHTTQSCV